MASLRISEILEEKGMTARQLAELLGKSPQNVNAIIHGKGGLNALQGVADALGVPMASLFADYEQTTGKPTIVCPHCGQRITLDVERTK